VIFLVQLPRLSLGDLALANLLIDAAVLVRQPVVDLLATRMILRPVALRARGPDLRSKQCGCEQ